ncbi:MAG: CRISPR-associated helicase Cas3' [Hydrogenophilales bacterium]|nr:CRISPR-associated helicase Cas3' [Hydrogenophilales bacterium]
MTITAYAHSANTCGKWHLLRVHLDAVGRIASGFVSNMPWAEEAMLAGQLHDLGKYGDRFQARLRGEESGLDHWSAGAWVALEYKCAAAALAIQGHHIGLQSLAHDDLKRLNPKWLAEHPQLLRLTAPEIQTLKNHFADDDLTVPPVKQTVLGSSLDATVPTMLDVRMLFSTLVDADYLDTDAHFEGDASGKRYRPSGPELDASNALKLVLENIKQTQANATASLDVLNVRRSLLKACLQSAERDSGLFTLTAPTGSGKTLAMLAFALAHAVKHGLDRIIMVIPYLTITEQTARAYRDILAPIFGKEYVLEHHSLAGVGEEKFQQDSEGKSGQPSFAERRRQLLAENWDAPLIVTTNVQLLESLFSNRPSACRKLHRLQRTVILFDEAQTLPAHLAVPTLAALSHLSAGYGSSVVFATATQPAFAHLDKAVTETKAPGWQPREIVPDPSTLFAPMKRVEFDWDSPDAPVHWDDLAGQLVKSPQALCIVNLKRHAKSLWEKLNDPATLHLSTNLCAAHRQDVLMTVRKRLSTNEPVHMVATQCVEAGVDLDFPTVMRAWGPLDAIIQAAGRCNREGRRSQFGQLRVFTPEDTGYPTDSYQQATQIAQMIFRRHGATGMDIDDPAFITDYYRELYDLADVAGAPATREIFDAIQAGSFPDVAKLYRLIKQDAINVLVPYAPQQALFDNLRTQADGTGLTAAWMRAARTLAVSLYRPKDSDPIWDALIPVPVAGWKQREQNDWFIYAVPEHYHPQLGLVPPGTLNTWIG